MAEAVARAKHMRISARKVRLVADQIRGKTVAKARDILAFTVKASAPMLGKLLASAVANAESKAAEKRERIDTDSMVVAKLIVDVGGSLKRVQPSMRGRRMMIRKRMSHVELVIRDAEGTRPARAGR